MRALMVTVLCMALGACNTIVHATLPFSEIVRLANLPFSNSFRVPARVMIQLDVECDEGKEAIMPALERYGHNVQYRGCTPLDRFWESHVHVSSPHFHLHVDMNIEIIQISDVSDADPKGLFGIGAKPMDNGRVDLFFIETDRLERVEREIKDTMGVIFKTSRVISIVFENDTSDDFGLEVGPAYIDRDEKAYKNRVMISRNSSITVVPFAEQVEEIVGDNPGKFASVFAPQ